jgi:hypothetical protein
MRLNTAREPILGLALLGILDRRRKCRQWLLLKSPICWAVIPSNGSSLIKKIGLLSVKLAVEFPPVFARPGKGMLWKPKLPCVTALLLAAQSTTQLRGTASALFGIPLRASCTKVRASSTAHSPGPQPFIIKCLTN